MALSSFPYLTATGDLRYRSIDGSGTIVDPDVAIVNDTINKVAIDAIGSKLPSLGQRAISGSISVTPATSATFQVTSPDYLGQVNLANSAGRNVKATSGKVYSLVATNLSTVVKYIQLFNKATSAINTDVPVVVYPVLPSNSMTIIDTDVWGLSGLNFSIGISWGWSTTPTIYTAGVATESIVEIRYV